MVEFIVNAPSVKRIAVVDKDKCKPDRCNHECKSFCPVERSGKEVITINKKAHINEVQCIGCGICVKKCPFDAITIINLTHEVGKLVHQYGENEFRIYNLPIIKEGSVIGLIGRNGIGKTTLLNILAGIIKPNLGRIHENVSWEEIIENFRGNEIQEHLKKIANKEIDVSYKIQRVDLLSKQYSGKKVKDLLEGVDEEIINSLELKNLLERKIESLSGGEMQKIVIAKSISKESELYFIDEPTSFLDIKNRIDIARIIKNRLQNKKVIVVEHDLVVMDYLADFIHIVYGYPGAYGVVSNIYHARRGINRYIEGYLKEENLRFRDYSIEFNYIKEAKKQKERLLYIPKLKKSYAEGFTLDVEEGEIFKGEVVGILGRNGIGKSTFMKILAGIEKDDENILDLNMKISYKPQYIALDYEGTVETFIFENISLNEDLENHLIKPLEIERIKHKNINNLSGGELQKVALLYVLSKDADIYLLDEPSSYLDVEERINLGKILRRYAEQFNTTLFVVDHDLLFLSSVSDRVMFFDGIPSVKGIAYSPTEFKTALNEFLKSVGITMRRDEESNRPRINLEGSYKDREMKSKGIYFDY